ncbi:MAG TPA: PAS domain S-box protein [Burkholderiales bacterium]|nr:PAS domain S-box protein [Burkholderiales bacterium]
MWLGLRAHVDQLAEERQQYVDFFEQSPEAYVVTDLDGTIRELNGAATDILQKRRGYLRGKPLTVMVALDHRREFRRRMLGLAERQSDQRSWRSVVIAAGERIEVTFTARPIERRDGGLCWLLQAVQ